MNQICFNGQFFPENQPILTVQNRSFKYGDGLFETIKVLNGSIQLSQYHFERLFSSLPLLKITIGESINPESLSKNIIELCSKNNCLELSRVRLAVYRNEKNNSDYVIEANPLSTESNRLNIIGFDIDIFPDVRESQDAISNLKSANFLSYILAELYAKERGLDDCLVLNATNHIAEASKANIFIIKNNEIATPALHQGCVNGVMRRYLIEEIKKLNYPVQQKVISEDDILNADEIFLTNAIYGIRWVKSFREKRYRNQLISHIYKKVLSIIYPSID